MSDEMISFHLPLITYNLKILKELKLKGVNFGGES